MLLIAELLEANQERDENDKEDYQRYGLPPLSGEIATNGNQKQDEIDNEKQ